MKDYENNLIQKHIDKRFSECQMDSQTFDTYAEIDNTLSFQENKQQINDKLNDILPMTNPKTKADCQMPKDEYIELSVQQMKEQEPNKSHLDLDNVRICAVMGDINTGKTNLAIYSIRQYKGKRNIYTLGYPKKIDNFTQLNTKRDILRLTDSIIFIDELSKFYPLQSRHTNFEFIEIERTISHNNNTIIFTTQLTQDLTNQMEAFVDTFLITGISDLRFLKSGSKAKFSILDCADYRMNGSSLNLKQGEYLQLSNSSEIGEDGIKSFPFQNIGKDWNVNGYRAIPNNSVRSVALGGVACGVACGVADGVGTCVELRKEKGVSNGN